MERLVRRRSAGLTAAGLHKWGMVFLVAGVFSRAILQNRMLGMADNTTEQLMELFTNNPDAMGIATLALALQALETCAVPIFSFLLVEGFLRMEKFQDYFLKILAVAVVTEIPYNLAMSGKLLDLSDRNPMFAMVLCLLMMFFFQLYSQKSTKNLLTKAFVCVAAFAWCVMLNIQYGQCFVVLVGLLWLCRNKPNFRILYGFSGVMACCAFSPFFTVSPMSLVAIHFYNGEPGELGEVVRFWVYPIILVAFSVASYLLF